EAKAELEKALSLDGTYIDAWLTLASMARVSKDLKGALADYDKAAEVKTTNAQDAKRRDTAIAERQSVIDEIERPAKLAKLCDARSGQETVDACNEIIRTSDDRDSKLKALWNRIAVNPGGMPSIEDATAVLGLDPNNRDALLARGRQYVLTLAPDQALADAAALLKHDANDLDALVVRMNAYLGKNDAERASADADAVLARSPDNADALFAHL